MLAFSSVNFNLLVSLRSWDRLIKREDILQGTYSTMALRNSPGKTMTGSPTKRREMDLMKLYVSKNNRKQHWFVLECLATTKWRPAGIATANFGSNFMAPKIVWEPRQTLYHFLPFQHRIKEAVGKSTWNCRTTTHTNPPPLALPTASSTQMLMKFLALFALMWSTKLGHPCTVCVFKNIQAPCCLKMPKFPLYFGRLHFGWPRWMAAPLVYFVFCLLGVALNWSHPTRSRPR